MAKKAKIVEYPVGRPELARTIAIVSDVDKARCQVIASESWFSGKLCRAVRVGKKTVLEIQGRDISWPDKNLWPECYQDE